MSVLAAGTALQGANFVVWTYIWDNFVRLLTANILLAYILATYCYLMSFTVKAGNTSNRELAAGGHSGNMLYDWFIGRELNPRINIPIIGEIDIKAFMELRPGLLGWVVLDCARLKPLRAAYVARQPAEQDVYAGNRRSSSPFSHLI